MESTELVTDENKCSGCDGWGYLNQNVAQQCPNCKGTGVEPTKENE